MSRVPLAAIAAIVASAGCIPSEHDLAAEYFRGTYAGDSSYSATVTGSGSGLSGAAPMQAVVDGVSTMTLAQDCQLSFDSVALSHTGRGDITAGTAGVTTGQTCTVPVDGGVAVFSVANGTASRNGDYELDVTMGGNLVSWLGMPTQGFVTFQFQGTWQHD
jgi:hypothetical protein